VFGLHLYAPLSYDRNQMMNVRANGLHPAKMIENINLLDCPAEEEMVMNGKRVDERQGFGGPATSRSAKVSGWRTRVLLYTVLFFLCLGPSCGYWVESMITPSLRTTPVIVRSLG
jgi:hypothetical protein